VLSIFLVLNSSSRLTKSSRLNCGSREVMAIKKCGVLRGAGQAVGFSGEVTSIHSWLLLDEPCYN
jgi:hypothetical protein